jgi:hypothetical protein
MEALLPPIAKEPAMQTPLLTAAEAMNASGTDAHLLIHTDSEIDRRGRRSDSPLQRLLELYSDGPEHQRARLHVEIHDLQGQQMLAVEDASPLLDVTLPAGTYHVSTRLGSMQRSYTMSLKPGGAFDLYLRLSPTPAAGA